MPTLPFNLNINAILDFLSAPSFQTIQIAIIIYVGLLWLAVIIWVTRDAIYLLSEPLPAAYVSICPSLPRVQTAPHFAHRSPCCSRFTHS